jgi:hypothetical protein
MDQLAAQTWHQLRQSYGLQIRWDEDTITSQLLIALAVQLKGTLLYQDGRKNESQTGCDFELWTPGPSAGWRRYAIQAKRITVPTAQYQSLKHSVGSAKRWQHDLLRDYAKAVRAEPLYLLYNHWDPALVPAGKLRYASTASLDTRLGCMIAPLHTARIAMDTTGARNYPWFNHQAGTRPWSTLLAPPSAGGKVSPDIAAAMAAIVGGGGGSGVGSSEGAEAGEGDPDPPSGIDIDAIVESNVHEQLPAAYRTHSNGPHIQELRQGRGLESGAGLLPRAVLVLGKGALD